MIQKYDCASKEKEMWFLESKPREMQVVRTIITFARTAPAEVRVSTRHYKGGFSGCSIVMKKLCQF